MPCPGNLLYDNAMLRAANSRRFGLNENPDSVAEIGSPPSAQTLSPVKPRAFPTANAATLLTVFPWPRSNDKLFALYGCFQINIFYNDCMC